MKPIHALTGGIACGKSTVADLLRARGAAVVDADVVAREVVTPPSPTLDALVDAFGSEILREDGTLDRDRLGALVFGDSEARARLEAITHPAIASHSMQALIAAAASPAEPIFYDAALLVEKGTWSQFASLTVVSCSPDVQRQRLMQRDHLTLEQAQARLDAQLPLAEKERVATFVLRNDGPIDALAPQIDDLLHAIRQRFPTA